MLIYDKELKQIKDVDEAEFKAIQKKNEKFIDINKILDEAENGIYNKNSELDINKILDETNGKVIYLQGCIININVGKRNNKSNAEKAFDDVFKDV